MARRLGYADALRILGQDDSVVLDFAEKLAAGALSTVGLPGLSTAGGAIAQMGRRALTGIREKITGVGRMDRTERVTAAYKTLAAVAAFEAADEVLQDSPARLSLADLRMDAEEQLALCEQLPGPEPGAHLLFAGRGTHARTSATAETRIFARRLTRFLDGLAVWERLDETARSTAARAIEERVPELARRRFTESYRQLAADVPEFGVWANLSAHEDTQQSVAAVSTGLARLNALVEEMGSRRTLDRRRAELAAVYQAALGRRLLRSANAPAGLVLPTMESAYLAPRGRFALVTAGDQPSAESWWQRLSLHDDLESLLAGLLTSPQATDTPIVVLGHPGAGKSVLTEMLAARLSTADFFALRVELRAVPPNAPLHTQIEEGLAATLQTRVAWRELADSAGGALPVVILDGFDELLQASGVNRSDYLEQVQEFQQRQEDLGQPVAVLVTSRTVVAERTRFPEETPVLRLEPFDDRQVARLVEIWSGSNEAAYTERGLRPPDADALLAFGELAAQPLLLLMLLVYDSEENALQRSGGAFSRGGLYEELLRMFARREVRKHRPHLGDDAMARAVDDEMHRLEAVAVAMFVRQRQHVTAADLEGDLAVLMPGAAVRPADTDLHGAVGDAHQVLGRFFFVHESQARQESGVASVYEFLHATFGEYLVARAVTDALDDLLEARRFAARRPRAAPPVDDGLLYALTSYALLAGSAAMVEFVQDLLDHRFAGRPDEAAEYRELLIDLFREAPYPAENRSYTAYRPRRVPVTERQAAYTANLVLLLTRVAPDGVDIRELFDNEHGSQDLSDWRALAGQWRGLPNAQWHGLLNAVRLRHIGYGAEDRHTLLAPVEEGADLNLGECVGFDIDSRETLSVTDPYSVTLPAGGLTTNLMRSSAMRINGTPARMALMMLPYLAHVGGEPLRWMEDREEGTVFAEGHDLLELRLAAPSFEDDAWRPRLRRFERLLDGTDRLGAREALVLRQMVEDLSCAARAGAGSGPGPHPAEYYSRLLRHIAEAYVEEVTVVDPGAPTSAAVLRTVFDGLGAHFTGFEHSIHGRHAALILDAAGEAAESGAEAVVALPEELQEADGGRVGSAPRRTGRERPVADRSAPFGYADRTDDRARWGSA
ncbi:NACHT domain-containing protein [Streptomonospora wellingtoniae]|uniref:ATP-binding protein n=1 Tax=Streptomonospora wellingtoniae TaxID=3075544 RepID=A0ABU2KU52_9ACTN|nr:ATP-binding protein [Streptomonospora sp. DSM 45055]MDT0302814.1 ATP-binding protein [Streptomonospora sp. DSM 45055]